MSVGQLKKFEIKIYGTSDISEGEIEYPNKNSFSRPQRAHSNWPGVDSKLDLPLPKYPYIGNNIKLTISITV